MAVDRNLFFYDLAVVSILKNEGHYLKEWLDYHLLAGVDHFYLYNHESTDNFNEVIQPYVEKGLVTAVYFPGSAATLPAYEDAFQKYRFFCRYMIIIDGDEFVFPKNGKSIVETADEILSADPKAKGLAMNWQEFGSNGLEKADYSKGVLERFTRRAKSDFCDRWVDSKGRRHNLGNLHIKCLHNPRYVIRPDVHFATYFENYYAVDETRKKVLPSHANLPIVYNTIVINHYRCKSKEEFMNKVARKYPNHYSIDVDIFEHFDNNDVFDDEILKYRNHRQQLINHTEEGGILEIFAANKKIDYEKICNALVQNLFPTLAQNISDEFYHDKMETFLICRALAAHLKNNVINNDGGKFFEEIALNAAYKTLIMSEEIAEVRMLLSELPNILPLKYPVVEKILSTLIEILPNIISAFRNVEWWNGYLEMEYLLKMLKAIYVCDKKNSF